MDEPVWARLEALAADARTRAVGEIGLDYFRNLSPPEVQREALRAAARAGRGQSKPVLVHDRDAHDDVTATRCSPGAAAASCTPSAATREMARRLTDAGFLICFALPVAFGSAAGPRAAAAALADGTFLVETDCALPRPGRGAPQRADHRAARGGRARAAARRRARARSSRRFAARTSASSAPAAERCSSAMARRLH